MPGRTPSVRLSPAVDSITTALELFSVRFKKAGPFARTSEGRLQAQFGKITRLPRELVLAYHFYMDTEEPSKIPLLIRRIMPDATEPQLLDATAIFEDYMAIAWRILKRLEQDNEMDSSLGRL